MKGLTEGRMVHYVLPNGDHRPAIVVKVWNKEEGYINVQVITDGSNDRLAYYPHVLSDRFGESLDNGMLWVTSIYPDLEEKLPNTWHWIEPA